MPGNRSKSAVYSACMLSAFLFSLLLPVSVSWAQDLFSVDWKEGRLSVIAERTPLSQILHEVARQSGLEVRGLEGLQEEVSIHFSSLPLHEGLQKLLAYVDHIVLEKISSQGEPLPTQVWVSGRGTHPQRASPGEMPEEEPVVEEDQERRLAALYASAQNGDQEALEKAFFDPDQILVATAFELLSKQDHKKAIAVLLEAAKSDRPETRLQALQLLNQSGHADDRITLSTLDRALGDEYVTIKGYAVQALAEQGTSEALMYLYRALHDPDPSVRMMVVEIVAQKEEGRQMLRIALRDDNQAVRSLATFWLEQASSEGR